MPERGLFLLCAQGTRPDRRAIFDFVRQQPKLSVSFDPAARPNLRVVGEDEQLLPVNGLKNPPRPTWVELLFAGLTFELEGLEPGRKAVVPRVEFSFDFDDRLSTARYKALRLVPGRHLSGGENSLPVVGAMLELACDMIQHFEGIEAVVWPASRSVIGRRFFESTVTAWLSGGAFPALGMTAFYGTIDGGLHSVGLSYFIGQELRIEPPLASDKLAATRLGIRLVNQLLIMGGLSNSEYVIAPDGSRLVLALSANGKFIRVRPA